MSLPQVRTHSRYRPKLKALKSRLEGIYEDTDLEIYEIEDLKFAMIYSDICHSQPGSI